MLFCPVLLKSPHVASARDELSRVHAHDVEFKQNRDGAWVICAEGPVGGLRVSGSSCFGCARLEEVDKMEDDCCDYRHMLLFACPSHVWCAASEKDGAAWRAMRMPCAFDTNAVMLMPPLACAATRARDLVPASVRLDAYGESARSAVSTACARAFDAGVWKVHSVVRQRVASNRLRAAVTARRGAAAAVRDLALEGIAAALEHAASGDNAVASVLAEVVATKVLRAMQALDCHAASATSVLFTMQARFGDVAMQQVLCRMARCLADLQECNMWDCDVGEACARAHDVLRLLETPARRIRTLTPVDKCLCPCGCPKQ